LVAMIASLLSGFFDIIHYHELIAPDAGISRPTLWIKQKYLFFKYFSKKIC
jgi:hypothetical protein